MIARWLANKLGRAVSRSWRALLSRAEPGFGVGKELTLEAHPIEGAGNILSASFEARLAADPLVAAVISEAREHIRNGHAVEELIHAANRSHALIGAHVVSGVSRENHYFLAVIPGASPARS